jgi:hypothetical protein
MIMQSTPTNGILIVVAGIFISAPFLLWGLTLYRRTKASIIKDIVIGSIRKSIQDFEVLWCIPLNVKANSLGSELKEVSAFITFVKMKKTNKTVWINPYTLDDSIITLQKGSEREIALVIESYGTLKPYCQTSSEENTLINDDIILELKTGSTTVGKWFFPNTIKNGCMQNVVPTLM